MTWPGIIGLGEMMDFPGVFNGEDKAHAEMAATRAAGKVIGGHYASPDLGRAFHAYVAGGPQDDHEGTRLEDAIARARQGMKVMLRYGSAWHDVAAQVKAVTELGLSSRNFLLCTDDSQAETLVTEGHMDRVVRHAISEGLDVMTAIQMATINTAEHFGVAREIGMIAPGRYSDLLMVEDLQDFRPHTVIAKGKVVFTDGETLVNLPQHEYPEWVTSSVHLPRQLRAEDFKLPTSSEKTIAHVIGVIENQAPTKHLEFEMDVQGGEVYADISRDIAKIALVERHQPTGKVQVGLVHGFGFNKACAVATTVAHDSHQMIVVGTDDAQMALAVNHLASIGGGQVVLSDGKLLGEIRLPIGGLMSTQSAERVAAEAAELLYGFRECGCQLNNPNMTMSLLGLVVIPQLRISDMGLVDVDRFDFIPVLEPRAE
jgi:adenine deaminase